MGFRGLGLCGSLAGLWRTGSVQLKNSAVSQNKRVPGAQKYVGITCTLRCLVSIQDSSGLILTDFHTTIFKV